MNSPGKSAHVDTFARDRLPPPEAQPEYLFELPELRFPPQLNCGAELLDVLVAEMGLVPGQRVLLRAPNNPMLAACWFAVMKAGAIAVTTMPLLRAKELAQVIAKAQVTHALCDARLAGELDAARAR